MLQHRFARGRVSFGAQEQYRVLLEGGGETAAQPSGALRAYGELPAVGDWVQLRLALSISLIEEVEPRRTAFVRKAAGRGYASQCVAANVDVCFVVCGLDGDFNLRRLERYLVLAWESGAQPVVVLNKTDVCADLEAAVTEVRSVAGQADVIAMSALRSVEPLRRWLKAGSTAVLLGSSGSGKSTIAQWADRQEGRHSRGARKRLARTSHDNGAHVDGAARRGVAHRHTRHAGAGTAGQ
jgi:ribosome biogenesis GTPase